MQKNKKVPSTQNAEELIDLSNSVHKLTKELSTIKQNLNNLTKQNKYLKDRLQNVEYRSSVLERGINQLRESVSRILRIFKQ